VDGLPVLAGRASPAAAPAPAALAPVAPRQVAALAAGGFLAGAATVAMVHRRRAKSLVRRRKARGPVGEILTSNSFLVDVHLLRRD
jgi:hypothetical protein